MARRLAVGSLALGLLDVTSAMAGLLEPTGSQPLPPHFTAPTAVAVDPDGNVWVVDSPANEVHQLTADHASVQRSAETQPGCTEVDIASDGSLWLTNPAAGTVRVLRPDLRRTKVTFHRDDLGVQSITALGLTSDGMFWVLDTAANRLVRFDQKHRNRQDTLSLPPIAGAYQDLEIGPDGRLYLLFRDPAVPGSCGITILQTSGRMDGESYFAFGLLTQPVNFAFDSAGDLIVLDTAANTLEFFEGSPPTLTEVVYQDTAAPHGAVTPGDELILIFDQAIEVAVPLTTNDLRLSRVVDSLGLFALRADPRNNRQVIVRLGLGANLRVDGVGREFTSLSLAPHVAGLRDPVTHEPVISTGGRDVQVSFEPPPPTLVPPGGATIRAQANPNGHYTRHALTIAPNALASPSTIAMRPSHLSTNLPGAVQIVSPITVFANDQSRLTLQFADHDFHNGRDGNASLLRIHEIRPRGDGTFEAMLLPGPQQIDYEANTITAPLPGTTLLDGGVGIFATLPLDEIDNETIVISRAASRPGGGDGPGGDCAVLRSGPDGIYTRHRLEFPGFREAAAGDEGVEVTIREANLYERHTFPPQSGAVFALDIAGGEISDPVDVTVEYRPTFDILTLEGHDGRADQMRLVHRTSEMDQFQILHSECHSGDSLVEAEAILPGALTGTHIFGVASTPAPVEVAHGLLLR